MLSNPIKLFSNPGSIPVLNVSHHRCHSLLWCILWPRKWSNPPGWCGLHWIRGCADKLYLWPHHYWLLPLWGCWCTMSG